MIATVKLLIWGLLDCFKSRGRLEAEVIVLRHQINILSSVKNPQAIDAGI
jgi:hypothetical protein